MKFLYLIWSNLRRRKLRTLLTALSILVAFVLYGYLSAIERALDAGVSAAGADRLIVRHRVSITQILPQSYQARIGRVPGVAAVAHATWFGGIYQDPKNFFPTMPVEPEEFLAMFPEFLLPEAEKKAWLAKRTGAIVGRSTANRFHWKVCDRIPITSPIWRRANNEPWQFEIVGIFVGAKKNTDTDMMHSAMTRFAHRIVA